MHVALIVTVRNLPTLKKYTEYDILEKLTYMSTNIS